MSILTWRRFPHWLIGTMGVVFAVNVYMVRDAYRTFPGVAGTDGFDLSNQYSQVMMAARRQAALGWQVEAEVTSEHYPVLRLTDRNGAPLPGAEATARAERPLGPEDVTELTFRPTGDGRYQTDTSLFSGQWDLMLTVQADGKQFNATRRIFVK